MNNYLQLSDLTSLGQIAKHCDPVKFNIAAQEAINMDLCAVFGIYATEVGILINKVLNPTTTGSASVIEKEAVNGAIYEQGGISLNNPGLKIALAYYALERYTILNEYNDTPNGSVAKQNPFSVPKPFKEVQQFASKYANLAKFSAEASLKFICTNIEQFPKLKGLDCSINGCGEDGNCGGNTVGYGLKSSNIDKYS